MKKLLAIIIAFASLLSPSIALGAFAAPWAATSTTQGWIFPNRVNGTEQTVVGQYFIATSTTASRLPYASSTALTVSGNSYLGTVSSGTWNGTAIGGSFGGTGQSSYSVGDTLYASGATTLSKLNIGNSGDVLTVNGGVPVWLPPSGGSGNWATSSEQYYWSQFRDLSYVGGLAPYLTPTSTSVSLVVSTASSTLVGVRGNTLIYTNSTTTNATTTNLAVSGNTNLTGLTSNGFVKTSGGNGLLSVDTNTYITGNQTITFSGVIQGSGATSITTSYSGLDPRGWNIVNGALVPTTTIGVLVNNSTSTITNLTTVNSTSTNATTTSLAVTAVKSALHLGDSNGVVTAYGGTSCTNQFPRSLSATGAATCATVANTDLANSSLTVSAGTGLTGGGLVSLGSSVSLSLDLTRANTWTGLQTFNAGFISQASSTAISLSVTNGTTTNATSTSFAAATICLTGDTCRTTWPTSSGGGGANSKFATSSSGYGIYPNGGAGIGVVIGTSNGATTTDGILNVTGTTTTTGLNVTGSATTTSAAGFKMSAGCLQIASISSTDCYPYVFSTTTSVNMGTTSVSLPPFDNVVVTIYGSSTASVGFNFQFNNDQTATYSTAECTNNSCSTLAGSNWGFAGSLTGGDSASYRKITLLISNNVGMPKAVTYTAGVLGSTVTTGNFTWSNTARATSLQMTSRSGTDFYKKGMVIRVEGY